MPRDRQLRNISLNRVLQKRQLDQALNVKEFSIAAGISYSAARHWFRLPGFPTFCGVVFWQDFVKWRQAKTGLAHLDATALRPKLSEAESIVWTGKAAQLLAEAGGKIT